MNAPVATSSATSLSRPAPPGTPSLPKLRTSNPPSDTAPKKIRPIPDVVRESLQDARPHQHAKARIGRGERAGPSLVRLQGDGEVGEVDANSVCLGGLQQRNDHDAADGQRSEHGTHAPHHDARCSIPPHRRVTASIRVPVRLAGGEAARAEPTASLSLRLGVPVTKWHRQRRSPPGQVSRVVINDARALTMENDAGDPPASLRPSSACIGSGTRADRRSKCRRSSTAAWRRASPRPAHLRALHPRRSPANETGRLQRRKRPARLQRLARLRPRWPASRPRPSRSPSDLTPVSMRMP